jgi:hypothetical protein
MPTVVGRSPRLIWPSARLAILAAAFAIGAISVRDEASADTDLIFANGFEADCTGDSNLVADGGLEAGANAGVWTEFSTNFGTPICSVAVCGPSGGTNARSGVYWAWFGGIDTAEMALVRQSLVIPAGTAILTFWLEVLVCDPVGSDVFMVRIDGQTVFSATNTDPACNQIGYVQKTIDVTAFANGDSHTLEFLGVFDGGGSGFTDFMVDDVRLESCP